MDDKEINEIATAARELIQEFIRQIPSHAGVYVANEHEDRDHWLNKRKSFVGGSDVCITMGMKPDWMERDVFSLVTEKRGGKDSFEGSDATDAGNYFERGIVDMARDRFGWGRLLQRWGDLVQDSECPRLACTPDAYLATPYGPAVCQVKFTRSRLYGKRRSGEEYGWLIEGVPTYILLQVQAEMAVTGWDHAVVLAFHVFDMGMGNGERRALHAHYVPRNEELIGNIRDSVTEFWRDYVVGETPLPRSAPVDF